MKEAYHLLCAYAAIRTGFPTDLSIGFAMFERLIASYVNARKER